MSATPFNTRGKTLAAAALSAAAILVVSFYVLMPAPDASMAAQFKKSAGPALDGRVKSGAKKNLQSYRVWVSIRRDGVVIKRAMVPVRRDGTFGKKLPAGTDELRVVIREGRDRAARATRGVFRVGRTTAVSVTATFPRRSGLVPSLFPY